MALLRCTNSTDLAGVLARGEEVEHALAGDSREDRRGDSDLKEHKLGRSMSIRADSWTAAASSGHISADREARRSACPSLRSDCRDW